MRRKTRFITSAIQDEKTEDLEAFVSIVLFSENHGYRMKSYGPISLMKIEGRTLIQRQVEAIKATFKNFEIILCSGFETQKTVDFVKRNFADVNIRVVENQIHFNSNDCESARLCLHNINNDRILMCNGALLITPEMFRSINYAESTVLCQEKDEYRNFDIGIIENSGSLESMAVGVKTKVWNEVLYLANRKIINTLYTTISNPEYKNRFLFEAINVALKNNSIIVKDSLENSLIKIQNIKTLKRITKI
jgi:bifunctional N-acetylglucosamine-1-phosphate-uridyltransferase/glucosamine-1-phosphate-acetyltransferase GlmU-like protein